jgi:hypothetical protein
MDTHAFAPPADITEDFKALQSAAFDDPGGEKLRRLAGYFEAAEMKGLQMRLQSEDFEDKELAGMLCEAFAAARRIVQLAAEKASHGTHTH